jgi:hypothetical protein
MVDAGQTIQQVLIARHLTHQERRFGNHDEEFTASKPRDRVH